MTIKAILSPSYTVVTNPQWLEISYQGIYAGDLLSIVLNRSKSKAVLITVLANTNVLAVASLRELPAVIITEGMAIPETMIQKADEEHISILSTELSTHEVILDLAARSLI